MESRTQKPATKKVSVKPTKLGLWSDLPIALTTNIKTKLRRQRNIDNTLKANKKSVMNSSLGQVYLTDMSI